jgi:predicted RNA binding protein YcfA (HicA-like mRNA interferase family)
VPPFGPIKLRDLIYYLRKSGFEGPFEGGRHQIMRRGPQRLIIPNPHRSDIRRELLREILKQANISIEAWEALK